MKTLYTAVATATDAGRAGTAHTDDGKLDLQLSLPAGLGGDDGPGTNPEQLFAAGYAACFANALRSSASRDLGDETLVDGASVTAHVDIGAIGQGGFGPGVRLEVQTPNLGQADAEKVVAVGPERCPYSNATRGNIDVALDVTGT